jgi:N-acetylglucosamine-6-phosphate deacetylase
MSTISFVGAPAGDAAPRVVDIHCHGALGQQFGDDEAGTRTAVAHHRSQGTGSLVASLVTASDRVLTQQVGVLAPLVAEGLLLGIHLEGPYLAEARCGAHDPALLRDPDPDFVTSLVELCATLAVPQAIRQITFAPERRGADRLIETCVRHGIRPAVGHTDADAGPVARTLGQIADATGGPALVTHLFNGMAPFHHRGGGAVSAALTAAARGEAVVELIADGVHLAPEVVRMVFETVGPDQVALVSDASPATGVGDGEHRIGALPVVVTQWIARLRTDDGTPGAIAGSTSTLTRCVEWAVTTAGVARGDALTAATTTPARLFPPLTPP